MAVFQFRNIGFKRQFVAGSITLTEVDGNGLAHQFIYPWTQVVDPGDTATATTQACYEPLAADTSRWELVGENPA